tara:strand:+ start:664 stop:816 length:153 start_codon:yes stop_codon:yes gene_type:complete
LESTEFEFETATAITERMMPSIGVKPAARAKAVSIGVLSLNFVNQDTSDK